MIKKIQEDSGDWTVYDDESMISATIEVIKEYSIIPEDKNEDKYKVRFGNEIISYNRNFNKAVFAAIEAIKDSEDE